MSATLNSLQASSTSSKTPDNAPLQQPGQLELRILTSSVGLYPPPNVDSDAPAISAWTTNRPPNTTSDFIRLLSGPLHDFLLYSHHKQSNWLIDIAHDICDPAAKRGSLRIWTGKKWKIVARQDRLKASVYLYDVPEGVVVSLSKISAREARSRTSSGGYASTMADNVERRDGQCWVSSAYGPLTNGHLCPKRMGDRLARVVFDTFVSRPRPATLSIYDEIYGISLTPTLDAWFDKYELGLRFVSTNLYECHSFPPPTMPTNRIYTFSGTQLRPVNCPVVHGRRVSPPHPEQANNPPAGLFRWHYLQCVIKKFAHPDYRGLQNIYHTELPLRMEGDSDDEGTDSELEWPSAPLDRGRHVQATIERHEERQRFVADWITAVK